MIFSFRPLCIGSALSLLVVVLAHCELLVSLDRENVDGGVPPDCPICTDLTEAGDDEEVDDSGEATVEDAGVDGPGREMTYGGADGGAAESE